METTLQIRRLFDCHLHIIDPHFPLRNNDGYRPAGFTVEDYLQRMAAWPLTGGVVVAGSFQGPDPRFLTEALRQLGPTFAGIVELAADTPDAAILELAQAGVRGLRFNFHRSGWGPLQPLINLGRRVHDLAGWHVELYVDAARLPELRPLQRQLSACSVDHLGLSTRGLPELLRWVAQGTRVKACGFSRGDLDIPATLQKIHETNPEALMFGSDLPCTRAPRSFDAQDITTLCNALDDRAGQRVFWDNAAAFYRLTRPESAPATGPQPTLTGTAP